MLREKTKRRFSLANVVLLSGTILATVAAWWLVNNSASVRARLWGIPVFASSIMTPSEPVSSSNRLRIPFVVTNLSSQEVRLADHTPLCENAYVENMPTSIAPNASRPLWFVVNPQGSNGDKLVHGLVSAQLRDKRVDVPISVPVTVHCDTVERRASLGACLASCKFVNHNVTLENLPVQNLARVANVTAPEWSIKKVNDRGRALSLSIEGLAPTLPEGKSRESFVVNCDLLFDGGDVRCAHVTLYGMLVPEWDLPELICIDPVSAPDRRSTVEITHRFQGDASHLDVVEVSTDLIQVTVEDTQDKPDGAWHEQVIRLLVVAGADARSSTEFATLRLTGDQGSQLTRIPIKLSGRSTK